MTMMSNLSIMNELWFLVSLIPFFLGMILPGEDEQSGTESTDEDEGDYWSVPSFGELDDAEEAAKATVTEDDTGASQSASTTESETTQEQDETPKDDTTSEADPAKAPEAQESKSDEEKSTSQQDAQTATQETQQGQQPAKTPEQEAKEAAEASAPQKSAEERKAEFQQQREAMETQVAQHYTQMYSSVAQEMGDEYDDAQLFGKLAAKVFSDATIAALQQSQNLVPALIRQETAKMETERTKETEFFDAFPELKTRTDLHPQVGKAYQAIKSAFPQATHEQVAEMAGNAVMQQNGVERKAQPAQNPQQQPPAQSQPKQQPFKPAAAAPSTPSPAPGNGADENNPWVGISANLWGDDV